MKKTIIVLIVVIAAGLAIGFGVFLISQKNNQGKIIQPTDMAATESASPAGRTTNEQPFRVLSEEPVFDYWTNFSGQEIFYIGETGRIMMAQQNKDAVFSEQTIENINSLTPAPNGKQIILGFGYGGQTQFSLFDINSKTWTPLALTVKTLAWAPDSKRLAALMNRNGGAADLVILTSATGTAKTILKNFSLPDFKMDWRRTDEILFYEKPSYLTDSSVWRLNLTKLNFDEIVSAGSGLQVKWLTDDTGLKFQGQKSSLINWAGQAIKDFELTLLPDKCVKQKEFLYCFLFTPAGPKTKWPDDYLKKSIYTKDSLYRFNLETGETPELVFNQWQGKIIDALNVQLFGKQMLFINRYDNQLYSLEISL